MRFDDRASDGESEPAPPTFAMGRSVTPVKAVEQLVEVFRSDTGSTIDDSDVDHLGANVQFEGQGRGRRRVN